MKTYLLPINVAPDNNVDGNRVAEVPIIPACALSCHSLEQVPDSIRDRAQLMLEMMVECGNPLPEGVESCEITPSSDPLFSKKAVTVSI